MVQRHQQYRAACAQNVRANTPANRHGQLERDRALHPSAAEPPCQPYLRHAARAQLAQQGGSRPTCRRRRVPLVPSRVAPAVASSARDVFGIQRGQYGLHAPVQQAGRLGSPAPPARPRGRRALPAQRIPESHNARRSPSGPCGAIDQHPCRKALARRLVRLHRRDGALNTGPLRPPPGR